MITIPSPHEARAKLRLKLEAPIKRALGPEFTLGEATRLRSKATSQFRFHILMRGQAIMRLSRLVRATVDKLPFPEDVAVAVDVDPYRCCSRGRCL